MKRLLPLAALLPAIGLAEPVWVGRFAPADDGLPPPWRVVQLDQDIPPTRYRLREWDGVAAVEAHAVKSMALLARPLDIDLAATPVLCWRWRIDAPLKSADMTTRTGDDYAAHIHLGFDVSPGTLGRGSRIRQELTRSLRGRPVPDVAINYIWDNRHAVGTWQTNVYSGHTRMLVLRSGASHAGRWVDERRDVAADFRDAFGHAPGRLTGLALASDTDNTGETARAGFADFRFVGKDESC
jgi:hypothetical protein